MQACTALQPVRSGELWVISIMEGAKCDSCALSSRQLQEVAKLAAECMLTRDARALVLDCRRIAAVTPEAEAEAAAIFRADRWPTLPVALVVRPDMRDQARRICQRFNDRGILRVVFTDPDRAAEWARLRREHWDWEPAPDAEPACEPAREPQKDEAGVLTLKWFGGLMLGMSAFMQSKPLFVG